MHKNFITLIFLTLMLIAQPSLIAMSGITMKFIESYTTTKAAYNRCADPESIKIFGSIVATTMFLDYMHNLIYAYNDPYAFENDEHDNFMERVTKPLKETFTIGCKPSICLGLSALTFSRILNPNPFKFSELLKPGLTFLVFIALNSLGSSYACFKQQQEINPDETNSLLFPRTSYRFTLYSTALIFPFFLKFFNKK